MKMADQSFNQIIRELSYLQFYLEWMIQDDLEFVFNSCDHTLTCCLWFMLINILYFLDL